MGKYILAAVAAISIVMLPQIVFATEQKQATMQNISAIQVEKEVEIYKEGTNEKVGRLYASDIQYVAKLTKNQNYYAIKIANKTYWIATKDVIVTNKTVQTLQVRKNFTIQTKGKATLFEKSSTKSKKIATTNQSLTYKVISIENGFYIVQLGQKKVYIAIQEVKQTYKNNMIVEVAKSTKLYKVTKNQKAIVGTLAVGTALKIKKVDRQYVYMQQSSNTYAIKKADVVQTPKVVTLKKAKSAAHPITLIAQKEHSVTNARGKKIGTIRKGQKVALQSITTKKGIIHYGSYSGYVKLSNYRHINIVNGKKDISYNKYTYYLKVLCLLYPDKVKMQKIGTSVDKRGIYAFRVGTGKKEVLIDAATHAREHMTTNVLMEMIDQYTLAYDKGSKLYGYNVKNTFNKTSIWFVPMINPDGVMLVQQGLSSVSKKYRANVVKYNNGSKNFNAFKANIRGVDINRNYPAGWQYASNIKKRSAEFYKGPYVGSEPETQAMMKFVKSHRFKTNLAYHASGQVLYWYYQQSAAKAKQHLKVVNQIRNATGYPRIYDYQYQRGTGAGQDWFIVQTGNPAMTVEIAPYVGKREIPHSYWESVWNKNKKTGLIIAKEAATR